MRGVTRLLGILAVLATATVANAQPAAQPNTILILGPTVSGGTSSVEATKAVSLGYNVEVVSAAQWGAKSTSDFASYRALVLGDPTCGYPASGYVGAAEANRTIWSPAVTGNVVVVGTDPVYHRWQGGAQLTESAVKFAADEVGKTGAYIALSCYYYSAASGTPVPVLDQFGTFTVVGQGGCPADSHIVASHPALAGTTDTTLSNWGCSTHEGFVSWPSDFLVLAISKDVPSPYVAGDGTTGAPYIMARGEHLVPAACGDGNLDPGEECDDSNTNNGDGCSAQCKVEAIACQALSAQCGANITAECTSPAGAAVSYPAGQCQAIGGEAPVTGSYSAADGSTFALGGTLVTFTASDSCSTGAQSASAAFTVTVVDTTAPTVSCVASVNPSGGNVPAASKSNEDGFYKVTAADSCGAATVTLGGYTLASGETIKITQTPGVAGVRLVNTMGPLQIKHFQVGTGDATITATDAAGHTTTASCLVPPPPK